MSAIKWLITIVVCLLASAAYFIISFFEAWESRFGSPANIQILVWAIQTKIIWPIQTKAWAIWDASLPVALSLFKILFLVGLSIVVAMFLNAITEGEAARSSKKKSPSDDPGADWWGDYNSSEDNPRYDSEGDPILFPNLFK